MDKPSVNKISRRLKAISDPTRIKILVMLSKRECCVCELTAALGLAQPTVSRHLKQLELEGFVSGRRDKNWMLYKLSPREECCRKLLNIVIDRAEQDPGMKALLERLFSIDRNTIAGEAEKTGAAA